MGLQSALKAIQDRQQFLDDPPYSAAAFFLTLAFDALAVVLKVGLAADHRLHQLVFFGLQAR